MLFIDDKEMLHPRHETLTWWLVPNLIALDAPIVAVVWQRFLAERHGVSIPIAATAALAAAVWCIYLTDRWFDARRGVLEAERHRAAARWPVAFACGAIIAGVISAAASIQLSSNYMQNGLVIGLFVVAYLFLIHAFLDEHGSVTGAKELLVAVGFAAGVAVPLNVDNQPASNWLPSIAAFTGVCFLNCLLIEFWESTDPSKRRSLWFICLLGIVLLASTAYLQLAVGLAIAGSLLGLTVIHMAWRHRPRAARVLADFVLLSPLVCWVVL